MANNIFIFSRPVRTGKTTELMKWIKDKNNVAGFLTPDIDERRMLFNIQTGQYFRLQLSNVNEEESVTIGKFIFSKNAFGAAKDILSDTSAEWLIIDEAGKLEIEQHAGLEPALSATVEFFKGNKNTNKLILVIRDSLVEKAVKKYDLEDAIIVHSLKEIC